MTAFTRIEGTLKPMPVVRRRTDTQMVRAYVYVTVAVLDALIVLLSFATADFVRHGTANDLRDPAYLLIVPLFTAVSFYSRSYTYGCIVSLRRGITQVATSLAAAIAMSLLIIFALKSSEDLSRVAFFAGSVMSITALMLLRLPLVRFVRQLGPSFMRRVLVVDGPYSGVVPPAFELLDVADVGISPDISDPLMLHRFSQRVTGADRVVVHCPVERRENWSLYLKSVDCAGELLVPELHNLQIVHPDSFSGLVGIRVSTGSLDIRNRLLKRTFDLAITVPAIVLLSPLLVLIAVAIVIDSGWPILFRQQRMGRANQLFDVLKFRSMFAERADGDGNRSAARDDDRVTRVGRILRRTSLDELPQLFNVINGDMSLVGPRPHALGSLAGDQLFWHIDHRYWLRHAIKPGLTGLAQVRGFRGATDHRDDLANRLESDLDYLANWSVLRDATILVRTAFVMVHNKAY